MVLRGMDDFLKDIRRCNLAPASCEPPVLEQPENRAESSHDWAGVRDKIVTEQPKNWNMKRRLINTDYVKNISTMQ